jgi:acetyl esterase/lipase
MPANRNDAMDVYQLWDAQNWGTICVFNVTEPTLNVYKAKNKNTGLGVVILPGGGYTAEAIQSEGHDVAKALADRGNTAAVLKYRLPEDHDRVK